MNARIEPEQWHLNRGVNLVHLFTTIGAIVSVAVFMSKWDTRIALLEQAAINQSAVNARMDKDRADAKVEVSEILKEMRNDIKVIREAVRR